jgi:outer membrane receptor protein involved in Fe transport
MNRNHDSRSPAARATKWTATLCVAATFAVAVLVSVANAQPPGRVRGKVVARDTGEPMSYCNLLLLPADTTLRRVGGMTNADGTFELLAAPGIYTLRVQALSYARKELAGVRVGAAPSEELLVPLTPEAIEQEEIVVEARRAQDTDNALLAIRRKAAAVSDAVSAEQMRRSPDKDAGDVLKRVTGLSVNEGKFVYVRGLGERYSSTEVDGVRLASPELNKRVVPLDIIPANLLENITVQKTYTADRPAEFGGGDVQVKTKDFPGRRQWSFSAGQGVDDGSTFERGLRYAGSGRDSWGLGASARALPGALQRLASTQPVTTYNSVLGTGLTSAERAEIGRGFDQEWTPERGSVAPNGSYAASFGDEYRLFGRSVGVLASGNYSRSQEIQTERSRYYVGQDFANGVPDQPRFDYGVERGSDRVQLGGLAAVGVRLAPAHSLHLRGFYNRDAEDEVRSFDGFSEDIQDRIRSDRLRYVERSILTGSLEGRHEFRSLNGSRVDWKLSRSRADRVVPDMRESNYQRSDIVLTDPDGNDVVREIWSLRGQTRGATREFSDMDERGRGAELSWSTPFRAGGLGQGRWLAGISDQWKERRFWMRRFYFVPPPGGDTLSPGEMFAPERWTGTLQGADVREWTRPDDNYGAQQYQAATFMSLDLPLGPRLRATLGARLEYGMQRVRSFHLFDGHTTAFGEFDHTDLLPSANLTWNPRESMSLRLGASRTLSRPDVNELAPQQIEDYVPGLRDLPGFVFTGNPDLDRARLDNYDVRWELFPSLGELVAVGVFHKGLLQPVELSARGGNEPYFTPTNSESGRNRGLELELRTSLGRVWRPLRRLSLNANASWIDSEVRLPAFTTTLVRRVHPLQGQADRLLNAGLTWATQDQRFETTLLVSHTGRKLAALGIDVAPDFWDDPVTTVDASVSARPRPAVRVKLSGTNLTDVTVTGRQGPVEYYRTKPGPAFSLSVSFGS